MNDENLYPNAGDHLGGTYYPEVEDDPKEEEDRAMVTKNLKLLDDVIKWFKEEIAKADSIDSIDDRVLTINGVSYETKYSPEVQLLAQKKLKEELEAAMYRYKKFKEKYDTRKR